MSSSSGNSSAPANTHVPVVKLKTTFEVEAKIETIYTGGTVEISKDEELLFCTAADEILMVNRETGKVVGRIPGESDVITAFAIRPTTTTTAALQLVSCSRSLLLKLWNISLSEKTEEKDNYAVASQENKTTQMYPWQASLQRSWKSMTSSAVTSLCFDSTGTLLAAASSDSTVKVWDLEKGYITHNFRGHEGVVTLVMFHPDPHRLQLFSCGADSTIRIWDLVTNQSVVLRNHLSLVTGLAFSRDGWTLVSVSRDKVVNLWDLRKNSLKKTVPVYEALEGVVILPTALSTDVATAAGVDLDDAGNEFFLTAGEEGRIRLFSVAKGRQVYHEPLDESRLRYSTEGLVLSAQRAELLSLTADRMIVFHSLKTLRRTRQLVGYNDEVLDVCYVQGGAAVAVATNSEQVRVFDLATHGCDILAGAHSDMVVTLDVTRRRVPTPDGGTAVVSGDILVTGSKDKTVAAWDLQKRQCIAVGVGHTEAIGAVACSRRGDTFVVSGGRDRTLKLWDLATVLAQRGKAAGQSPLKLPVQTTVLAHDKDINAVAVSPNDRLVATGSLDKTAKLWALPDLTLVGTLRGHRRGVWNVRFSPVDQCVATASADRTVKLWSLADFTCLRTLEGHSNSVLTLSFLSAGMQLLSAGSDGLIKLWTIKSGECEATFEGHADRVWTVAVRHDEAQFVSGGSDSVVNMWKDMSAIVAERAAAEEEQSVLKLQELSNLLLRKDYQKALRVAFSLEQPFKVYEIFEAMTSTSASAETINDVVAALNTSQTFKLLGYVRDWNTNSKYAVVAQRVLHAVFSTNPPWTLEKAATTAELRSLLEALIPYTDRHLDRINRLLQASYIVDYTLHEMRRLAPALPTEETIQAPVTVASKKRKYDEVHHEKEPARTATAPNSDAGVFHRTKRTRVIAEHVSADALD